MEAFIKWLESRVEDGRKETARLKAEGRADDAGFASARANIYDVCRAVSRTLLFRPGAGAPAVGFVGFFAAGFFAAAFGAGFGAGFFAAGFFAAGFAAGFFFVLIGFFSLAD